MTGTTLLVNAYSQIRPLLATGDVVAFKGQGWVSDVIMKCTGANVSHIGIIRRVDSGRVYLTESTTLNPKARPGVFTSLLSDRLIAFQGKAWVLRLSDEVRANFDPKGFEEVGVTLDGLAYDMLGALDLLARRWLHLRINPFPGHVFCSCLVTRYEVAGGALPGTIYGRNEAPADVAAFRIYNPLYHQVVGIGQPEELKGFNTRAVEVTITG